MTILAAIGKHLLKAFVTNPKGVLKFLMYAILLPLVILCILIVSPLAIFTHLPLIEEETTVYQDVEKDIFKKYGVAINVDDLIGLHVMLLQQHFAKSNFAEVRAIGIEFVGEREVIKTRKIEVACTDPKETICFEDESYTEIEYYALPFDAVLAKFVAKGIVKQEWIEDIKRYATGAATNETKVDMENLPDITDSTFMRPATGRLTSGRGWRWGKMHQGVDIGGGGRSGVPIVASADGVVSRSQVMGGFGQVVMIKHNINGQLIETVYAHMVNGSRKVSVGQTVTKGQILGTMGQTGASKGVHLHFEVHVGPFKSGSPNAVDPLLYVKF